MRRDYWIEDAAAEFQEMIGRCPAHPEISRLPFPGPFRSNGARVQGLHIRPSSKGNKMSSVHWDWEEAGILGGWVEFEQKVDETKHGEDSKVSPEASQDGETSDTVFGRYIIDAVTGYGFMTTGDGFQKIKLHSDERVSNLGALPSLPFDVIPVSLPDTHVFFAPTDPTRKDIHDDGDWRVYPDNEPPKSLAYRKEDDSCAEWKTVARSLPNGSFQKVTVLESWTGTGENPVTNYVCCEFPAGLDKDTKVFTSTGFFQGP